MTHAPLLAVELIILSLSMTTRRHSRDLSSEPGKWLLAYDSSGPLFPSTLPESFASRIVETSSRTWPVTGWSSGSILFWYWETKVRYASAPSFDTQCLLIIRRVHGQTSSPSLPLPDSHLSFASDPSRAPFHSIFTELHKGQKTWMCDWPVL